MAGLGIRVFTDEHLFAELAAALRARAYDAESCQEAGRAGQGLTDEQQLEYAASRDRAILTFDRGDFVHLDRLWKRHDREHAGIIVTRPVDDFGELLRRAMRHLDTYPPSVQHNMLLWLDPSPTR